MEIQTPIKQPEFIVLNNKLFAEYFFIFRINDSFRINELSKFNNKHQLLFKKIENINQQMNLMFVDSTFPNILADLTLEVLLNKITSFKEYMLSKTKLKVVEESKEDIFYKYKFLDFIHHLLYSNISTIKKFKKEIYIDRIFCSKNSFGELEFFSLYEQVELQSRLLNKIKFEIDFHSSKIVKQEVVLCLKIYSSFL